jgi:hypothetical protein
MKNLLFALLFFIILTSCDKPCNDCGDPNPTQFIKAKILNQQGQNLIFGSTALYHSDSIRLLKEKNNLSITNGSVSKNTKDSTLLLEFYNSEGKIYIYYNQQTPQDSLEIKYLFKSQRCCGKLTTYSEIDSVKFNSIYNKPVNGVVHFVK